MQSFNLIFIVVSPLYALAVFYLCRTFFLQRVTSKKTEFISYMMFYILLCLIFLSTRIPMVFLLFNIISFFLLSFNYRATMLRRIMGSLLIYGTVFVMEIVVARVVGLWEIQALSDNTFDSITGLLLNRVLTVILSRLLYRYVKTSEKTYVIPNFYYIAHILILLGTVYLFAVSLEGSTHTLGQILVSGAVLVIINGMILFLDEAIYRSIVDRHEKRALQQQNQAYANQMELMEQSATAISSVRHDMKNHIFSLKAIHQQGDDEAFQSYIHEMIVDIESTRPLAHSGHFIVDSIINFKLQLLQVESLDLRLSVEIPEHLPIMDYDLTALLGNLLDNAVTAVNEGGDEGTLVLHIDCNKGNFIILLDNSHGGTLTTHQGRLKSTKSQPELHGIGLRKVEEVVSKYQGTLDINYGKDMFAVAIVIPLLDAPS